MFPTEQTKVKEGDDREVRAATFLERAERHSALSVKKRALKNPFGKQSDETGDHKATEDFLPEHLPVATELCATSDQADTDVNRSRQETPSEPAM